jgi:hypothetical protein
MMPALLSVLFSVLTSTVATVHPLPEGTSLHIRLTTAVGSYASVAESPVGAVLIAPVIVNGETLLEAGSTLAGRVKGVTRVGLGVRHETAGLDLEFNQITPVNGEAVPIASQVAEVDNGRERVTQDGNIQGVRSTGSLCYRVSGYIRTALQWEIHAELAEWAIRSLIMELPEPEIYYPVGVELTLRLTQPLSLPATGSARETMQLTDSDRDELARLVSTMPSETRAPISGRESDLTNILLIGSRDQIARAFDAAGWKQADAPSLRGRIQWIRAAAELKGDQAAPMSLLLLNGAGPDMSWQKGLNDVSKRHHIRLWEQAARWHGRQVWIGAATRDVNFAYMRPGSRLSHRIAPDIDQERDKVAYDLAFSSCASVLAWSGRPDVPRFSRNATGDPIATDGAIVAVQLNDCQTPRRWTESANSTLLAEHGDKWQRFARREILSARNELLRTNPVWRTYEASRWLVESIRRHQRGTSDAEFASRSRTSETGESSRFARMLARLD